MMSCAWLWMYFGAFLMFLELASPGFVIFFFGLSAATVGLLRFALADAFTLTWQLAAFSGLSILYLAVLRRWMKKIFTGQKTEANIDFNNDFVGRIGKVTSAIEPPLAGRVEIGDAEWTAEAAQKISVGATVRVVAQRNLTMTVESVAS